MTAEAPIRRPESVEVELGTDAVDGLADYTGRMRQDFIDVHDRVELEPLSTQGARAYVTDALTRAQDQ